MQGAALTPASTLYTPHETKVIQFVYTLFATGLKESCFF